MAAKREIKTTFALDGERQYKDAIKGINKEQALLNAQMKASASAFDASGDKQAKLSAKAEGLTKQIQLQKQKVAEAQNAVQQATKRYDDAAAKLEDMRKAGMEGTDEFKRQQAEVDKAADAVTRYKIDVANAEAGLGKMQTQLAQANKDLLLNESRLKKAGDAAENAGKKMQGIGDKTSKVGSGMTKGITVPIAAAAAGLMKLAGEFDNASDTIRIGTGATGDALKGLEADFEAVLGNVPSTMEDTAGAIADLNTRLGLTGKPLQSLAQQYLELAHITGENVTTSIEESTRAFQAWNVPADKMGDGLNTIFKVSQATGIKVVDLTKKVTDFAPTLLIGKFEQAGVNSEAVLGALKKSAATFAKDGKSMSEGLADVTKRIKEAGSETEATRIAIEVFGARAGGDVARQIRAGKLDIDEFAKSIASSGETIGKAAEDTYDWQEQLQMLKNGLAKELKPVSDTLFKALNDSMPAIKEVAQSVGNLAKQFSELPPETQATILKLIALTAASGPVVRVLGGITSGAGKVVSTFGKVASKLSESRTASKAAADAAAGVASGLSGMGGAAEGATGKLGGLGGILGKLANPTTGLIALAIGAAIALGTALDDATVTTGEFSDAMEQDFKRYADAVASANGIMEAFVSDTTASGEAADSIRSKIEEVEAKIAEAHKRYMAAKGEARKQDLADLREYYAELAELMGQELTLYTQGQEVLTEKIKGDFIDVTKENVTQVQKSIDDGLAATKKAADDAASAYLNTLDKEALGVEEYERLKQKYYNETYSVAIQNANKRAAEAARAAQIELEANDESLARQLEKINGFHGDATKAEREYYDRLDEIRNTNYATELERSQAIYSAWQEFSTKQSQIASDIGKAWLEVDETTRAAWLKFIDTQARGGTQLDKNSRDTVTAIMQAYARMPGGLSQIGRETQIALGRAILNTKDPKRAAEATDEECKRVFEDSYSEYQAAGADNAYAYAKGVEGKRDNTRQAGKTIAQAGKEGAASVSLYGVGEDSAEGYVRGLLSRYSLSAIRAAARKIGLQTLDALRNSIWSFSPSRKMMEIGEDAGEGYAIGIEEKQRRATDAIAATARASIAAAQREVDRMNLSIPSRLSAQINYATGGGLSAQVAAAQAAVPAIAKSSTDNSTHVSISIPGAVIRSDADIRALAKELAKEVERTKKAKGA